MGEQRSEKGRREREKTWENVKMKEIDLGGGMEDAGVLEFVVDVWDGAE